MNKLGNQRYNNLKLQMKNKIFKNFISFKILRRLKLKFLKKKDVNNKLLMNQNNY